MGTWGAIICQTEIGLHIHKLDVHAHTHTAPRLPFSFHVSPSDSKTHTHSYAQPHTIHFQRKLIHNMAWQRKFSAGSFMEWESSLTLLPWCHFLSNGSSVSGQWILSLWLQPTHLSFCPVKINETLSISGVHMGREGSMHLDCLVWPKESGELRCLLWWVMDWPPECSHSFGSRYCWVFLSTTDLHLQVDSNLCSPPLHYNMESGRRVQCVTHLSHCINDFAGLLYWSERSGKSCPCLHYSDTVSQGLKWQKSQLLAIAI